MKTGIVILPQLPWHEQAPLWQRAERYGFAHAWTYDHLSWRSLAGEPWAATVPTLTAAALATSSIRLGTFVASPNFRHPVPFAKDLATIDEISGGRFILGVGAGTTGFDAAVLGQEPLSARERHERFVEFVTALDRLLRFEEPGSGGISFTGRWYSARNARMVGEPAQAPRMPLAIAANGPRGIAWAARTADIWMTLGLSADTSDQWWRSVRDLAHRAEDASADRAAPLRKMLSLDAGPVYSLSSQQCFADMVGQAEQCGFTDVVAHWPRPAGVYAGDERVLEAVAAAGLL